MKTGATIDRGFLISLFGDKEFINSYSIRTVDAEIRAHKIISRTENDPQLDNAWNWIVTNRNNEPIGIVELPNLDFFNQSTDLMLGFPGHRNSPFIGEAFLLILGILFHHLGLRRITTRVYGHNSISLSTMLKLGFKTEAILLDEVVSPATGARVTLHVFGLLRDEAMSNPVFLRIGQQLIGAHYPDVLSTVAPQWSAQLMEKTPWWREFPPKSSQHASPPLSNPTKRFELGGSLTRVNSLRDFRLAPITEDHRGTLHQWFNDQSFIQRYWRSPQVTEENISTMIAEMSPSTGSGDNMYWIAENCASQQALGLICLLHIDRDQRTAELKTGFTDSVPPEKALQEAVLIALSIAFNYTNIIYLKTHIYADNDYVQSHFMQLGFQCLGLLRSDVRCPVTNNISDTWLNRASRHDYMDRCSDEVRGLIVETRIPCLIDDDVSHGY